MAENPVVENKRMLDRMMERIWTLYDRVPPARKKTAQRLIDEWFYGKRSYEGLLRELERLAGG